jgi:DNA replicative helicase MCM subunit Mcm2 (Cdc46/Mcm family)
MSEIAKQHAIQQFLDRVKSASEVKQIENANLHAGSPMYFYCTCCGVQTEVLKEDFMFRPYAKCSQCFGMDQMGWLDEAIKMKG